MINFEEELKKFHPSLEVEDAEKQKKKKRNKEGKHVLL